MLGSSVRVRVDGRRADAMLGRCSSYASTSPLMPDVEQQIFQARTDSAISPRLAIKIDFNGLRLSWELDKEDLNLTETYAMTARPRIRGRREGMERNMSQSKQKKDVLKHHLTTP